MVATIGIDLITDQFQCHAAHMTNWITWAPSHGLRLTIGRQRWLDESLVSLRDQGLIHAYGAYPWKDRLLWRLHGPGAPRDLVSIVLAEYYVQALCDDVGLPWRPVPPSGGQDSYHQVRAWTSARAGEAKLEVARRIGRDRAGFLAALDVRLIHPTMPPQGLCAPRIGRDWIGETEPPLWGAGNGIRLGRRQTPRETFVGETLQALQVRGLFRRWWIRADHRGIVTWTLSGGTKALKGSFGSGVVEDWLERLCCDQGLAWRPLSPPYEADYLDVRDWLLTPS